MTDTPIYMPESEEAEKRTVYPETQKRVGSAQ